MNNEQIIRKAYFTELGVLSNIEAAVLGSRAA